MIETSFNSDFFGYNYPLGIGKVENISPLVCFLLSDGLSWITGQEIIIDGGGGESLFELNILTLKKL
ncbi:SDR family oxidoreductase [Campylobacter lari]|uniref:SDR family oxidoreductase n=1 Tax=Campylobacter lari TaxID=201 RepID=UPI002149C98C|nr:SDR family oxidoreductase [Campylobacter lari]MCR2074847.1 SDR family oxidoreductase [Campylobacter lari subsp. concheus]